MTDLNDLAYWFPPLERAGLHVPRTKIVKYEDDDLIKLLDGNDPDGFDTLLEKLVLAADELESWPCFLRTGHLSGKHSWNSCCYVEDASAMLSHVAHLVEESAMGFPGLPTDTWVVREFIPTAPLFHCRDFGDLPVTREFRLFVREDQVEHTQPYWPADALVAADPDDPNWRERLSVASLLTPSEWKPLANEAKRAVAALGGGFWSVDFLQDANGDFWLIDMAEGDRSFRYEP